MNKTQPASTRTTQEPPSYSQSVSQSVCVCMYVCMHVCVHAWMGTERFGEIM